MQSNDKKAARFISVINAEAEQQSKKIKQETDRYIDSELKKTRAAARAKAKVTAKAELSKLDEQSNTDSYKLRTQQMTQIISKRNEITNGIFEKAEKRIADFTKSDGYLPFLKEGVSKSTSMRADDTLDARLAEQKVRFYTKSGLSITG